MSEVDLGWSALAGLAAISVGCAAATLLAFRRFSDQQAIARTKNRAQAHLLEFRLFMDEPLLVLRAQGALLRDQGRLLALLTRPLLVVTIPMLLLLGQLEAIYGRVPLRPGRPAVVTIAGAQDASLEAPAGIAVETPPVHVDSEVSWRVRPLGSASGDLRIVQNGRVLTKSIAARWGLGYTSERRVGSMLSLLIHPTELPLSGASWIDVRYPDATILGWHWLVWFLLITTIAGLLLRRPLRVAL